MVVLAKILLFVQVTLLAAALGAVVAFLGLILVGTMMGASTMEGGLAMGAVDFMRIGGFVGAIIGGWLAWRLTSRIGDRGAMAGGYGLLLVALLAVGGWFLQQELTDGAQ